MTESNINQIFAKALRIARKHRRLTQLQLAQNTGLSKRMIGYYESGKVNISLKNAVILKDYLDIEFKITNRPSKTHQS